MKCCKQSVKQHIARPRLAITQPHKSSRNKLWRLLWSGPYGKWDNFKHFPPTTAPSFLCSLQRQQDYLMYSNCSRLVFNVSKQVPLTLPADLTKYMLRLLVEAYTIYSIYCIIIVYVYIGTI